MMQDVEHLLSLARLTVLSTRQETCLWKRKRNNELYVASQREHESDELIERFSYIPEQGECY